MSTSTFLDVLREVAGPSAEPLSAGEREFLLTHAGMSEGELGEGARAATRLDLAASRVVLDTEVLEDALTTAEVAELLDRAESNVRRSRLAGDLYAVNPGDPAGLRFPRWQFTARGSVVPGMRRVLAVLPPGMHPVGVSRVMTEAREELEGMSPVEWLAAGGRVEDVVEIVEDLGHL